MLRQLLRPDWMLDCTLAELPLQELLDQQIRALVLDVAGTLLPRRQAVLPVSVLHWLQRAQQRMPIHLFSNNPSRKRVGRWLSSSTCPTPFRLPSPAAGPCGGFWQS